jgi:hypothetical protein
MGGVGFWNRARDGGGSPRVNPILKWYLRVVSWFRRKPVETDEAKRYRIYFSDKLLKHQIDTLKFYDPDYAAKIPQNPETLKRMFPHESDH